MRNRKKVIILGAGGHARETLWIFREANEEKNEWEILGFIDENKETHGKMICDLPLLGGFEWLDKKRYDDVYAIAAIGSPKAKFKVLDKAFMRNL